MTTISKMTKLIERETKTSTYIETTLENPTIAELQEVIELMQTHPSYKRNSKFDVYFMEDVNIQRDKRNRITKNKISVRFFKANGHLCYTFRSRSGYYVREFDYQKIINLSVRIPKDIGTEHQELLGKILNRRYDEQTWSNLTAAGMSENSATVINIKRKFPPFVIKKLEDAFLHKTEYNYTKYGKQRDLTVSTKMCVDGVFRAWFTSEYAGCGNGQYYVLLNPTTASFCEWD